MHRLRPLIGSDRIVRIRDWFSHERLNKGDGKWGAYYSIYMEWW